MKNFYSFSLGSSMYPSRKFVSTLFLLLLLSCSITTQAQTPTDQLKTLVALQQKTGISIGVAIHNTKDSAELFSYNGNTPLNPASVTKIITSTAALTYMGGAYEYKTPITTDKLTQGVAQNLYIKGIGDPSLVEERLWRIAKDLMVRGVKKVAGDIVIDNSFFDGRSFPGQDDDSSRAYNAPLSALAVNFNSFAVVATNDDGMINVAIDPPISYFDLQSSIKLGGNSLSVTRSFKENKEFVRATGSVSDEVKKYANITNPVLYAGTTMAWALNQAGIEFNGKVREGAAVGKKKLLSDDSKPLCLILRDLNKWSNNFTAEMVLKTLSAVRGGEPGTTEKGVTVLHDFLIALGVNATEFTIQNGSGLSQNNRISPHALNKVLLSAYHNNRIRSDFMASLAIGGVDGTLKSRFRNLNLQGNVKAKTGTLDTVSSLAGYLETKSKQMIAFTIIVNGPGAPSAVYHDLQEKLLLAVYENY